MKLHLTGTRALVLVAGAALASAAGAGTINVTTNVDEDNGYTTGPSAGRSKGCSLREALQSIENAAAYNGCTGFSGTTNTINLAGAGGTTVVNSLVPVPNAASGTQRNGLLPFVTSAMGTVIITGGTVTCDASPNGLRVFTEQSGASLTLSSMTIGGASSAGCTASGGGIGVQNTGGDLTLNTVTFNNVHSDSGADGGAVYHSGGTLNINNGVFLNNGTSDTASPSAETGNGGAIAIGSVSSPSTVNINNTSFTTNVAARNGGAIYWTQSDTMGHTFTITNGIFTSNVANGGTGGNERGGGAIFASTDSGYDLGNLDLFLIANGKFITNVAEHGQGGAILLIGQLSSIDVTSDPLNPVPAALFPATGGIIGSDFSLNVARGAASSDALGGAGGALYARGNVSIVQSSFRGNVSQYGSGGAIALRNPSTPHFVNIANVTFNANSADQAGGAVANLHASGTLDLVNDTMSGNTASGSTSAGNTMAGGGSVYNANSSASAIGVRNTILGTVAGDTCAGSAIENLGNNLQLALANGCGAGVGTGDANLNTPSIFAGPNVFVFTMSIAGDHSPAQGTGDQTTCAAQPIMLTDGTGRVTIRPSGDPACDIGAFESTTTFPVDLKAFGVD